MDAPLVPLEFDCAPFEVKCHRCGNAYPGTEAVTDDAGKLLCEHCNRPTGWSPLIKLKPLPRLQ
jgi:hypothetical protein